jgi:hypothetical protein
MHPRETMINSARGRREGGGQPVARRSEVQRGRGGNYPRKQDQQHHHQRDFDRGRDYAVLVQRDDALVIRFAGGAVQSGMQLRAGGENREQQDERNPPGGQKAAQEQAGEAQMWIGCRHKATGQN